MKKIIIAITVLFIISNSFSQTTTDITFNATLTNSTNITKVRIIKKGEIISNTQTDYNTQIISVYDVELNSNIIQTDTATWLVSIPPNQSVNLNLKCRCLNKGLGLPSVSSLVPTDCVYNQQEALNTQQETWKTIKQNTGIYQFNCFSNGNGINCKIAIENAIKKIFLTLKISLKSVDLTNVVLNTDCEIIGVVESIDVVTSLDLPAKLININIENLQSSEKTVKISGDIFIEPKYQIFFGKQLND